MISSMLMKNLSQIAVILIVYLLVLVTPSDGNLREASQPNLAVLEFTVSDNSPNAADWAFGVADLLAFDFLEARSDHM